MDMLLCLETVKYRFGVKMDQNKKGMSISNLVYWSFLGLIILGMIAAIVYAKVTGSSLKI